MAMHRWTRLTTQKWEDVWRERLRFLGPSAIAMVTWPESNALKIEAYCNRQTAIDLVKRFGGRATKLAPHIWSGNADSPRAPLSIRGRLYVHGDEASWKNRKSKGHSIYVPAGMAFGSGEHATTATCLRLLADAAKSLPPGWSAIDAGTGSGILAIAAEKFGATAVHAFDADPACVRIATENARKNSCRAVKLKRADVRRLAAFPVVDVILANLFSGLLIQAAKGLAGRLQPGGLLIFSGVLRAQSAEVAAALVLAGFAPPRILPRGKWCAGVTHRRPSRSTRRARGHHSARHG